VKTGESFARPNREDFSALEKMRVMNHPVALVTHLSNRPSQTTAALERQSRCDVQGDEKPLSRKSCACFDPDDYSK